MEKIENDSIILEIALLYDLLPDLKYYDYNDYPTVKIGRGNPYHKCKHCGVSDPEINMSNARHANSCQWVKAQDKIKHLKGFLNEYEKKNLNDIIENLNNPDDVEDD